MLVAATVVEAAIFAAIAPGFFSVANALNILLSVAVTGILAVGMTAVIITAGIDLSWVRSWRSPGWPARWRAAHGFMPRTWRSSSRWSWARLTGVVNGTLTAYLQVPAFVVTLAMLTVARGLAFIVSGGRSIGDLPVVRRCGRAVILGIPAPVLVMAAVMLAGAFVLRRTVFGRHVYAIGGNTEAAWLAGVDTKRVIWWVYVLNGPLAGIGGLTLASRLGAGVPNAGQQYELDVIAAVVVGGASLFGGRGTIAGTLWGRSFIGVLTNGLNLANVDPYVQKIALGVVIVLAVVGDEISRRRAARRAHA